MEVWDTNLTNATHYNPHIYSDIPFWNPFVLPCILYTSLVFTVLAWRKLNQCFDAPFWNSKLGSGQTGETSKPDTKSKIIFLHSFKNVTDLPCHRGSVFVFTEVLTVSYFILLFRKF